MQADLVIVGGGIGGLAAATVVARAGLKVVVVERSSHVGGRATSREMGQGIFNQGPHALYRGGPAMRLLRRLGVRFRGKVPSTTALWVAKEGAIQPLTAGPLTVFGSPVLRWHEKFELARILAAIQTMDPRPYEETTLDAWLHQVATSPRGLEVMQALTRVSTYTNAREVMSAGAAIRQMRAAFRYNVLYLDGGWQTLVDGLQKAATASGVEILAHADVESVESDSGQVSAVRLHDGRTIQTKAAILAVSPSAAASLTELIPSLKAEAELCVPANAACLDVSLRRLPQPDRVLALGLDEPTYFSVHSRYSRLTENGAQVVQVAKYLLPGDPGLDARPQLENLLDLMQPGWRAELIDARFMPRMTVMQSVPRADRGGLGGRAPVVVPDVRGLFRVGDSVGPKGMLTDAVMASADTAALEAIAFCGKRFQNALPSMKGQLVA